MFATLCGNPLCLASLVTGKARSVGTGMALPMNQIVIHLTELTHPHGEIGKLGAI